MICVSTSQMFAQATLPTGVAVGTRVRVRAGTDLLIGRVTAMSPDSIILATDDGQTRMFTSVDVSGFEISGGLHTAKRRTALKGAGLGAVLGSVSGLAIAATNPACTIQGSSCDGPRGVEYVAVPMLGLVGAAAGAITGAIMGARPSERWTPITTIGMSQRVGVAHASPARVSLGASVHF